MIILNASLQVLVSRTLLIPAALLKFMYPSLRVDFPLLPGVDHFARQKTQVKSLPFVRAPINYSIFE